MFTASKSPVSATRSVVVPRVYRLLCDWRELGYTNLELSYSDILGCVLPGNTCGQAQSKFIGEACRLYEDTYGESVTTLLPTLPPKAIALEEIVVGVAFVVTKVASEILPKVVSLEASPMDTEKLPSAPLAPCF